MKRWMEGMRKEMKETKEMKADMNEELSGLEKLENKFDQIIDLMKRRMNRKRNENDKREEARVRVKKKLY